MTALGRTNSWLSEILYTYAYVSEADSSLRFPNYTIVCVFHVTSTQYVGANGSRSKCWKSASRSGRITSSLRDVNYYPTSRSKVVPIQASLTYFTHLEGLLKENSDNLLY
jgi:hypothetical protein